jgi:glucan phosphorylase
MKKCSRCKQELPFEKFNKGKSRHGKEVYQSFCKNCSKEYQKEYQKKYYSDEQKRIQQLNRASKNRKTKREENTVSMIDYLKTHHCIDCGESDPIVLEFDHQRDKRYQISRMLGNHSWENILKEIEKCDVRCANCHRRRTSKQFNWKMLEILKDS